MTNKLFFKKYPIKVEFFLYGNHYIKTYGANEIQYWSPNKPLIARYRLESRPSTKEIVEFAKAFAPFESKISRIRSERSHFNVYFSDQETLDQMKHAMKKWIVRIYCPENADQFKFFEEHTANKVLCQQLPYKKFKYKIVLSSNISTDIRVKFDQWLTSSIDHVHLSKSTKFWLQGNTRYCNYPFMYVSNPKILSMILLYLGSNIKAIEEFIVKDNINT